MLSEKDISGFKKALEAEKRILEEELPSLGERNPDRPSEWEPTKPEGDEFGADRNDNADIIEDMEENSASLSELEGRFNAVVAALAKIEEGTYGACEVCGEDIEADRLAANPAAPTCKKHMN